MTDIKISQMPSLTNPASNDLLPIIDVSETDTSKLNKKITVSTLLSKVVASSGPKILQQDTIWYVDSTLGSDTNNGLTRQTAFKTLNYACFEVSSYLNPKGYSKTILLLPGVHEGARLAGYLNYGIYKDRTLIKGGGEERTEVTVKGIVVTSPSIYYLENLVLAPLEEQGCEHCLVVNGARIEFGDIGFAEAPNGHHIAGWNHACIEALGDYYIYGSPGFNHIYLDSLSFMDTSCVDIDESVKLRRIYLQSVLNCNEFIRVVRQSLLSCEKLSIIDSTTGGHSCRRYYVSDQSLIQTYEYTENSLFPGNQNGLEKDWGKYSRQIYFV